MNYLDAVYYAKGIGRRKEEPQQPEKEDTSFLDDALEFGKLGLTQGMILPNFLGGLATEAAGNVLQGLGNLQRNSLAGQYAPEVADLLQSLGEGATGVAETMANTGTSIPRISYKSDPTEDTPSKFINQMNSAYTGAYGNIARFLHADKVADVYGNKADELRVKEEERPAPDFTLDYLLSGLPVDFGELAGSMGAIAPAMAALPESAVASALNPITREMINRGMYGAAKVFSQLAPQAVRYGLTSAPLESGMEGGQTRANLLAQGYSDEEATKQSAITALKNMALLLPTNTLEGLAMFSPLARAGKLATAGQIGGRGLLNTAQQSYEEFAQEGIQNAAEGKPYSYNPFNGAENQYEAAKHTAGPAALMGLVGGGVGAYRNRNVTDEQRENEQSWNRGSQGNISNDDYRARAEKAKGANGIDNFMRAISGQESGDNYDAVNNDSGATGAFQIMPENWSAWAQDAGLPADAPMTPENQNLVARNKMQEYYNKFGNWRDVAIAWYGGEGAVSYSEEAKNRPQGEYPSINEYADSVMSRFEKVGGDVSREGIHYLGDNGKGEGNTWQRQNDNVSLDGAQPDLLNAIDVLGKWFYDRTGKKLVVTAGTNGKHADGEHSHTAGWKVDVNDWDGESDGYLVTADGSKGSLTDEFIKFGQSIGLGMNWEGDHIDVALDGTQWGGSTETTNFGGFKRWRESPKRQAAQPSQEEESSQQAPPKPLFDITREDNQAQDIFKQFAEEKALNSNTNEEINFFDGMFDTDGIFQNTKENRDAIRKDYADEFISFAQSRIPTEQPQQIQPTQSAPTKSQPKIEEQKIETPPEDSLLNSDDIKGRMIKYLQSLESTPENNAFRFEIGKAWDDGNQEKVRQMLESRGASTTPIQPDPVTKNKPPENVLPKPKEKLSGQEKLINVATKAVPVGNKHVKARKKQGKALMELATQNNIEIPQPEMIALQNGSTKAVQKWRDELLKRGLSSAPQAQETSQQENSQMQTPQENSVSAKILQARKARAEQENKARAIANNLLNMSEADESFVKRESPKQSKTPYESWEDLSELSREHDITGTSYEKELQQRQVENIQSTLGSQDTALQRQTAFALSEPSANKQERKKQGNALLNLLERPQIKYAVSDSRIVNSLKPSLKVGAKPAILKAQEILNGIEAPEQQIKDELQLEDETQESRISRSEDLEDLFNEQNQQETQQPLTQEEIDKRLSQLGQISQEEADEYLNGITKQVQPQPQSQAPEENSAPQVQEQPQQEDIVKKLVEPARLTLGEAHGAKLEKILRDAQKEFSRILEADKYPEVKLAVDFSLQGAWAGMGATDNADVLKASIEREAAQLKKQRNADSFPDFVLANVVGSINDKAKQDVAWKVVKRFESGELTFEEAYKEAKHAIEIGDQSQESTTKGKTAEVLTDNRAKYPVTYKVIEADDLNVSHLIDETGNVRTNITSPAELQPRDRNRAGYRDTVLNRANNLDPKQLGESENVNQGAPVTRSDGVVLNGNGRVMAIRRAYDIGKGDNYKNSLIQNAEKYGLNSEKIAAMKNPVLVRELGENLSAEDTENIIGSKQGGEKLSAREQAKADAQKISTALLAKAPQNGDLSSSNDGLQFVADVINTIATPEEKNSLMTSDGAVSDAAVTRVKDALFTMAYGDNNLVDNLTESAYSDTSKTITTAMRNAAPKVAQARARMQKGEINQVDLSPITNAAQTIKSGTVVLKDLITPTLEGFDSRSNDEKDILGFFNAHKSNPNEITKFLNLIADNLLNNKKGGMFEDVAQTNSLANAIANARQQVERQEVTQQHLENQAMRNQIAAQLHNNLKTKNDPSLKAQINGLIKDAAQGDNEALRIINRIKGNAPSENNLFAEDSSPSKLQEAQKQNQKRKSNQQKNKDYLYSKLKADTHSNIKVWLDDLIAKAGRKENTPERAQALHTLAEYREGGIADWQIDLLENLLQEREKRQAIPKTEDNAKPTPQQAEKPHEELDKELDAKAKKFFEKFERQDNQGKSLIGATLKFNAFPTPEDVEKSAPITDGVDGIAKKYSGRYGGDVGYGWNYHFKTTEDRDNFIRSVMNSGVLKAEIDRQQKAIQEREKAVTEYKNKVERIINGVKEKAYEILEADKYPEIKSFVDRSVQNAIQSDKINTVEKAEDLAKRIVPSIKKYKETGQLPKGVLWELWRNKYGDPNRVERKYKAKFETVDKIIKQVEDGKLPLEKAYEDVKYFLETGRRKKENKSSKTRKTSEEQINEAAKNPDTAKALEQLGAKVENGKVTTPDVETQEAVAKHVENERVFAWHGTPHDFDNFSTDYMRTGEGSQSHGWGLYFASDKKVSENYKQNLARLSATIDGVTYLFSNNEEAVINTSTQENAYEAEPELGSFSSRDFTPAKAILFTALQQARRKSNVKTAEKFINDGISKLKEENVDKKTVNEWEKAKELLGKSEIKTQSHLYKSEIPSPAEMLDEDKTLSEQPPKVRKAVEKIVGEHGITIPDEKLFSKDDPFTGRYIYQLIGVLSSEKGSQILKERIKGKNRRFNTGNSADDFMLEVAQLFIDGVQDPKVYNAEAASKKLKEAGVKGITYVGESDGRCYVVFDDEAIKILEKYSKQGKDVDTTIKNYVDQKDLTPQQQLLQDFGRKLGTRVIFFNNGDGRFHGQHSNGITYLNVDSNMPLGKVFWHESMHWIKANNPKLYQALEKASGITDEQRQAYLNRTERNDLPTDEAIDEEIIADQFEDVAKRSGLLQSISGKNRGLIGRVIQWLQDTMKKFVDYFRNPQGKLTTAQAQALTDEFGKIANELTDPSGEKIFRYNRRTHNIELADGRDWDSSAEHSDNRGAFSLQPKYSIDASDNSNESTLQRIRNKITAFIGSSDAPSKRRNKRITQFLEKLADIRILTGHIKGAKNIDVDEFHRLLKSKKAYDWENILPEIGGMLAKSLNLNDSQEMRNYFTDWLLTGAPNNNSAEAKAFQQAARNNPAMFEILQNIRNEFDEIQNLSAEEFYGEKIIDKPPEKTLAEHLGYYKDNWREEFIDDLRPIERMFEQVVAKAEKTNPKFAKWLKETVNPYEMARLLRGIDSVAEIMIGEIETSPSKRINEIRASLAQAFPNVNFSRFKPIAMILEEIGALNDKKTRRAFESYCVAKLDKEMHEKKKGDPEKYGYLQPLGTEEQADAMIAKYEKQFGQAQKDLVLYSNTMLTIMYDAGILTKNKYNEILHSWKNYIPTARVFDENEEYDFVDSFKQKTGSNRDVWSPLQKMIANTTSLIKQAERNKIKCQIAQLARCGQFGQIIAVTENSNPNPDTDVAFYEYGKKYWLNTPDPSIVRALSAIQSQKDGAWIVKAFNAVMSWFKGLQTFWNPDFSVGNIFRDSAAAYIHNKHLGYANPFMFFADVARIGFKGFWTKDANWIEWKAMGGSQSSYVSEDVDYVQRSISDLTETGLESFKKHPFSYILDRLQYIAEASETATRLTTYVKARDALAAQRSDGKATLDDKRHAALASRNATIDFAKAGTSTRKANRVFAFANAAVQDFALQAQTFSPAKIQKAMKGDKQAQQQIFSAGFRLLAMGVIPTLIQFALMHRDDDKKKIYRDLHAWEKETYWYFGDLVHIPKSMDIGIRLTSAITDEFLKTAIDKDPAEWRRFRRLILDAAPGLTATLFTPLIEAYANYSLFRDAPIVPAKEQHLPGHLQYGYDTSSVAKIISDNTISIAKIFGAETGFSPRKIDYLINGYLGFMGRFFSHIPNYAGRGGISLDEIPIARRFLYEPYRNPKIVKDYYEALDEQASLYNGYKLELQQGKKVKPPEDFDPALYQRLKVAQESMRKLSNLEKRIQEDEKLSDNQRKEKLRELELRRVALCEKVFNKAR